MLTVSQLTVYQRTLHDVSPTLLPEHIARLITAVSLAARLSLRCSSLLIEVLLESAKYSTSFSFGISRQALITALSSAKRLHALATSESETDANESGGFLQVLDKYTSLGIYIVHHTFTLAELFAMSGLQFTSQTVKSGFMAAEESVHMIDSIFGSNETSRAIASIITLVHRELMNDPDFELAKVGKIAILSGLTKAMTAFAVLQSVTHRRTMQQVKISVLWKGVVEEEEESEQALIQFKSSSSENLPEHSDIIDELETILTNQPTDDSDAFEITTTTRRTTTRTTKIAPVGHSQDPSRTKYVTVKSDEEEQEAFVAFVDQTSETKPSRIESVETLKHTICDTPQPEEPTSKKDDGVFMDSLVVDPVPIRTLRPAKSFRILLSAVSKKLTRKKVERQEQTEYEALQNALSSKENDSQNQHEPVESTISSGPITTMTSTSTSTTLFAAAAEYNTDPISEISSSKSDDEMVEKEPEHRLKRRSSWSRLKLRGGAHRKSIGQMIQKGADILKPMHAPPPPLPTTSRSLASGPDLNLYSSPSSSTSSYGGSTGILSTALVKTGHDSGRLSVSSRPGLTRSSSIASITSLSSMSHTMTTTTTTTYTTPTPTPSSPRSICVPCPRTQINGRNQNNNQNHGASQPDLTLEINTNFPRNHIVHNIAHFMRYASAAYGESFMRILGIGDIPQVLPTSHHHHPNHHAFAHHTGLSVQDILLSSYTDMTFMSVKHPQLHALVHYVTVDHSAKAVVLTCRGTLGLSDVLTDLTCDYANFTLPADQNVPPKKYIAHGGMLEAAQLLAKKKGRVFQKVCEGLLMYPEYGLVICGHSLGGGVASLLSVLWSQESQPSRLAALSSNRPTFVTSSLFGLPAGRPIHCYAYGPPCTMSQELSEYCGQGLVTSVVHGFDIVSSLSLGLLRDFKNVAVSLHAESGVADDILGRVMGRYNSPREHKKEEEEDDDDDQWFWALIKTMRADMRAEKLYPPSTVYLIESVPQLLQNTEQQSSTENTKSKKCKTKRAHNVVLSRCDDIQARFSEIVFSRSMFMDHSPFMYEKAILQLRRGYFGT
ncbi:hypothetical protein CLU79DRAFT_720471 [Phycomyces nitens]|nr:hypothetical protein CLU79DRAFT_720471 [Phycomyces nitens]